jgi:alcohol dehydrogenase class IV
LSDLGGAAPAPAEFAVSTRVIAGRGCVRLLGDEVRALGVPVIGVVADAGFHRAGLLEPLLAGIDGAGLPVCGLVGEDPGVAEVEAVVAALRSAGAAAVLVVGGGSALCAGKAAAIRLRNPGPLWAYEGRGRLPAPPAAVVAVPTTAGSGSEVSNVVVLHDPGHDQQLVIFGRGYEPRVALLDGELLRSLPARPMIAAALDALSHACEALWARRSTRFTDALALAAARALRRALPAALGGDVDAMQQLVEASAMANLACGHSGLGLVHALTASPDVHLPHGYQNGVLLPHVAAFNAAVVSPEAAAEMGALGGLYAAVGFEPSFRLGEIGPAGVERMVAAALGNPHRQNNRRPADEDDLRALLARAGAT